MQVSEIKLKVDQYLNKGQKLFTTCSFQSHSLVLLHIISGIDNKIPVVFLNTGYHFPETLAFRDQILDQFGMKLLNLRSDIPKSQQKGQDGKLLFTSDPDYCCYLNKTQPLEAILKQYDVWINGIRSDQSDFRKQLSIEQPGKHNTIRFHPLIDWTPKMILQYRTEYDLPAHPLQDKGYLSIGCEPCTRKFDIDSMAREARWYGLNKTECGIQTDLVEK